MNKMELIEQLANLETLKVKDFNKLLKKLDNFKGCTIERLEYIYKYTTNLETKHLVKLLLNK